MKTSVRDLDPGDEVVVLRDLDATPAKKGMVGVCFREADFHEPDSGPMVRFENGSVCNVYEGDVERVADGLRPATLTLARVFLVGDPDLCESTCGCCEGKRQLLKKMASETPWVLEALK